MARTATAPKNRIEEPTKAVPRQRRVARRTPQTTTITTANETEYRGRVVYVVPTTGRTAALREPVVGTLRWMSDRAVVIDTGETVMSRKTANVVVTLAD